MARKDARIPLAADRDIPRVVRARDLVRQPWKNGGGTTAMVAVSPPEAALDNFDWRISMADVGSDGPFSLFPGVDRTLVLIEGLGLEISTDGVTHRLDAASPLLSFAGEHNTSARLLDGPIRDLNVMTRRGVFSHAVRLHAPGDSPGLSNHRGVIALVALQAPTSAALDGRAYTLDRLDVLIADRAPACLTIDRPALLIRLMPAGLAVRA